MFMRKLCYFPSKGFELAGAVRGLTFTLVLFPCTLDRSTNYVNGDKRRFILFYGNRSVFAYLNLNDCG